MEGPLRPLILTLVLCGVAAAASAHHGSAAYDTAREVSVSGVVRDWRWSQPHTWIYVEAKDANGRVLLWEGEGPPLSWARQRGWSEAMFRVGEEVTLLVYPSRDTAHAGLVKRITRRGGETIPVSRPWLDR